MLDILKGANPHDRHDWTLTTRLVAEGYGVKPESIRSHKSNHSDELLQDHHYIIDGVTVHWTKAGVIRLGMFIKSEEAIVFRNAAESYLCNAAAAKPVLSGGVENINASSTLLDAIVEDLADDILAAEIRQRLDQRLQEKRSERRSLVNAVEKLRLSIPQKWSHSA